MMPLRLAVLPFLAAIGGLLATIFWWEVPLYIGLLIGWAAAVGIAKATGSPLSELAEATWSGLRSTFFVVGIMTAIGGLIATWLIAGTVPGLIVFGIDLIQPEWLVVSAFLLTAGTSVALGTSVGTLSTMGAALAGMALVYDIPAALIGGALVSGAMVGDRMSPLSSAFHLLAGMTGTKTEQNYKPMLLTGLPILLLCTALFAWLGHGVGNTAAALESPLLQQLRGHFELPWVVLLPPVLVLTLAAFRVKILHNLALGALFGAVLAVTVQAQSLGDVFATLWFGYDWQEAGQTVLHGGGVWTMFNQALLIAFAGALNGVMERTGMLTAIVNVLLARIRTATGLLHSTMLLSFFMTLVACNQSLAIIVPGRTMRASYDQMGVPPHHLVRSLADSGVVLSPLVPWNLHGILCSTAIGVATTTYWPYAFYLWGLLLTSALLAFFVRYKRDFNKHTNLLQF